MEPFPPISTAQAHSTSSSLTQNMVRPTTRRKSSSLGADPRGDTGAGSFAAAGLRRQDQVSPPTSPIDRKPTDKPKRERKRKKAKRLFQRWKRMSLRHTWVNPLVLILIILAAYYINPGEQNPLHSALFLSYPNPPLNERTNTLPPHIGNVTQYGKGPRDFAFVAFYTIVFTFTREFIMQRLVRPIAIRCGIRGRGKQSRFMEQFYTAIYFSVYGPFGLWVMSRTPVWYFNTTGMYEGFPHRAHEAWFKAYYLLQASYWAQQGIVLLLQLEKPRKDFKELVLHHLVTLALIFLSYRFHFTYIGIAVYITHDISDFFLATSKVLNYLDSWLTGGYFVMFIGVWAYLRHYVNLAILASLTPPIVGDTLRHYVPAINFHTGEFRTVGPYDLNWDTQQYKCSLSQVITFGLLAILQAVNMFWFFLIIRILLRYVFKGVQKDERSEDETEELIEEEKSYADAVKENGGADATAPQVMLNGKPVVEEQEENINVATTGIETRRSPRRRHA